MTTAPRQWRAWQEYSTSTRFIRSSGLRGRNILHSSKRVMTFHRQNRKSMLFTEGRPQHRDHPLSSKRSGYCSNRPHEKQANRSKQSDQSLIYLFQEVYKFAHHWNVAEDKTYFCSPGRSCIHTMRTHILSPVPRRKASLAMERAMLRRKTSL